MKKQVKTKEKLLYRPPVVVVLGHVDHGKTTLLDAIRKTNTTDREIGNITQHIGAWEVSTGITDYHTDKITFIDTPGHEAFSKLRSRGARVADIAILIVDGVDSVMPQTVESIYHIKDAKIPFIVVINKSDLPGFSEQKVKKDLAKNQIQLEGMGGEIPFISLSAKKGENIKNLLESILLIASEQEFTYKYEDKPEIYIIETQMSKAGTSVSCIIKNGHLSVSDFVYCGEEKVKIRALFDDRGNSVSEVVPSMPFALLGLSNLPEVGSRITTEELSALPQVQQKETEEVITNDFFKEDKEKKLNIIIKADNNGSLEAILAAFAKNNSINITLSSVGDIAKSDIFLAKVSKSIIVGFGIKPDKSVQQIADQEKVIIKTYDIIYELLKELEEVSRLIQERDQKEKSVKAEAKIVANFIIEKERVAGMKIIKGKISLKDKIELYRNNTIFGKTQIISMRQRAKPVEEVKKNEECGVVFSPQLDFQVGDVVKSYSI